MKHLIGRLHTQDYRALLQDFREARSSRLELEAEAVKNGSKFADLLAVHGMNWWRFYDLPLAKHLGVFFVLLGWAEEFKRAASEANPQRAVLAFMREATDRHKGDLVGRLPPAHQAIFFNLMISVMYSMESVGYYTLSINELLAKAAAGHRESLLKAVCVDRTVICTATGSRIIAEAQLRKDKAFLSGLFKRVKSPHAKLRVYADLRLFRRVLEDAGAFVATPVNEVFDLVTSELQMTAPRDAKSLNDLFRVWEQSVRE